MSYSPAVIANYFLDKASLEARALTPMQLLKLVYIAHGWHLGYTGRPLINETVCAWRHGPVITSLYDSIKKYGSGAITEPVHAGRPWERTSEIDPETTKLIDSVWSGYRSFSGIQLSAMTHRPDTPWHEVWHSRGRNAPIEDELIERHYRRLIQERTPR